MLFPIFVSDGGQSKPTGEASARQSSALTSRCPYMHVRAVWACFGGCRGGESMLALASGGTAPGDGLAQSLQQSLQLRHAFAQLAVALA